MQKFTLNICHELLKHQFVKFLFVGALNSAFGYGCFAVLVYAGLHFTFALFLATIFGVIFNFKSTGALVFGSRNNRLIYRFIGSYVVVYIVNAAGIKAFSLIEVTPYVGGAILILPMAALAFILNKRFVFNYD
ncbi:GtrA family protein [Cupriavidus sp. AcVe19-6a]|uniref:GtrA family protein n=1 Tax=Cupriavidus sp. AcVe19-6a TaxID=2821358 RepID=UPI001AE69749|nr:GtrA family protein [Cupriavidus sp. AcVe19-6a]